MGNGVKALLVALLILSVVIIAKVVQDESDPGASAADSGTSSGAGENPGPEAGKSSLTSPPPRSPATRRPADNSARPENGTPARVTTPPRTRKTEAQLRREAYLKRQEELARARKARQEKSAAPSTPKPFSPTSNRGTPTAKAPEPTPSGDPDSLTARARPRGNVKDLPGATDGAKNRYDDPLDGNRLQGPKSSKPPVRELTNINPAATTPPSSSGYSPSSSTLAGVAASQPSTPKATSPAPSTPAPGRSGSFTAPLAGRSSTPTPSSSTTSSNSGASASSDFPRTHEVQSGDSYWRIARKHYGENGVKHYMKIHEANRGKKLIPGMKIEVPAPPVSAGSKTVARPTTPKPAARKPAPTVASSTNSTSSRPSAPLSRDGRHYLHKVVSGDTLSGLAKKYYSNPRNYGPILQANPDLRFMNLQVGETIKIPKK